MLFVPELAPVIPVNQSEYMESRKMIGRSLYIEIRSEKKDLHSKKRTIVEAYLYYLLCLFLFAH